MALQFENFEFQLKRAPNYFACLVRIELVSFLTCTSGEILDFQVNYVKAAFFSSNAGIKLNERNHSRQSTA